MNSQFQWRSGMRPLGGAVEPARDLWHGIAARIAAEQAATAQRRTRRMRIAFALAATLVIALGAGVVAQRGTPGSQPAALVQRTSEAPHAVLDWAQPADPKLASAAHDLDNASAKLQDALEQRPDAVFLVGLLNRTNAQRVRLLRQTPYTG